MDVDAVSILSKTRGDALEFGFVPALEASLQSKLKGHLDKEGTVTDRSGRALNYGEVVPPILDNAPRQTVAMDGAACAAFVENVLVPEFQPETVVLLDNLATHKTPKRQRGIHRA